MKELDMIIRPGKLEDVKEILDDKKCGGMTISTAMGCGAQHGFAEGEEETVKELKGMKTTINLLPKIRVQIVLEDEKVEEVIIALRDKLATDHVGDGKIFIRPIEDAIRIRTGERGDAAL